MTPGQPIAEFERVFHWPETAASGYGLILFAVIFILLGMTFLLYGFRVYRVLIPILCAIVGGFLGYTLAAYYAVNLLVGTVAGAAVLGIVGWTLYRIVCSVLGGLYGVAVVLLLWPQVWISPDPSGWIALAVAFVAGFVLVLVFFRAILIILTAISGAAAVVTGVLTLMRLWPEVGQPVISLLGDNLWVNLVLVAILAIIGVVLQFKDPQTTAARAAARKPAKKKGEGGEE
jgi:hypothetical protein